MSDKGWVETEATVIGRRTARDIYRNKWYYTWLKVDIWPNRILTFSGQEEFLPYGARTAERVRVRVDPRSLGYDGNYITATLEVLDAIKEGASEGDA